ncbi:DegQ family serine endoprotease [Chromobacterium haemolyticum]|uniref:Probable periplasmic serine endoprotease DegP-like n=1 Tax=Chromobacterium fluminis TaxID=3044269 RepID=A0ABX0LCW3_9NEIS|nr:DegQ family serine endoprotease [Chromobacterium haemolyticum]NHR07093.1 DegQ family serine endoprotease [Chromobacterium haemolyticum]
MPVKKLIVSAMLAASIMAGSAPAAMAAELPDFSQIVSNEGKAVVNISTKSTVREVSNDLPEGMSGDPFFEFFRRFAPPRAQERQESSLGSGFIISADGYVLTNAHVVARADEITVKLTDKREYKAKVIGSDARTDVALLKIEADKLPVVRRGDANALKVGEGVLAIGSPFGFENTATSGIVSGKNRMLPDETLVPFIQTDAAINPGNSGGPLFNARGEVVGVNSQIFSRSGGFMGISFAIPIDVAMDVVAQLKAKGHVSRGKIGVVIQELSQDLAASFGLAKPAGALITAVEPGGPAAKAGVKPGDIIQQVDGKPVESGSDLQRLIGSIPPGKPVTLGLWRARAAVSAKVVPVEQLDQNPRLAQREYRGSQQERPAEQSFSQIGLRLQVLNPAQLQRAGIKYGLLVRGANNVAMRAGIQPGDVIVGIGSEPLANVEQLKSALSAAKKGSSIALQVLRQGATQFIPLPVGDGK